MYFVGMMGTGKSTVARSLANVMGRYIFLDTDSIIEELLTASVGEVFETDGEEAFRSVESQVLDQVRRRHPDRVFSKPSTKCRSEKSLGSRFSAPQPTTYHRLLEC